jgi:hypothetical protein
MAKKNKKKEKKRVPLVLPPPTHFTTTTHVLHVPPLATTTRSHGIRIGIMSRAPTLTPPPKRNDSRISGLPVCHSHATACHSFAAPSLHPFNRPSYWPVPPFPHGLQGCAVHVSRSPAHASSPSHLNVLYCTFHLTHLVVDAVSMSPVLPQIHPTCSASL